MNLLTEYPAYETYGPDCMEKCAGWWDDTVQALKPVQGALGRAFDYVFAPQVKGTRQKGFNKQVADFIGSNKFVPGGAPVRVISTGRGDEFHTDNFKHRSPDKRLHEARSKQYVAGQDTGVINTRGKAPYSAAHEAGHYDNLLKAQAKMRDARGRTPSLQEADVLAGRGYRFPGSRLAPLVHGLGLVQAAAQPVLGVDPNSVAGMGLNYGIPLAMHAPRFIEEGRASLKALKYAPHMGANKLTGSQRFRGKLGLLGALGVHALWPLLDGGINHGIGNWKNIYDWVRGGQ